MKLFDLEIILNEISLGLKLTLEFLYQDALLRQRNEPLLKAYDRVKLRQDYMTLSIHHRELNHLVGIWTTTGRFMKAYLTDVQNDENGTLKDTTYNLQKSLNVVCSFTPSLKEFIAKTLLMLYHQNERWLKKFPELFTYVHVRPFEPWDKQSALHRTKITELVIISSQNNVMSEVKTAADLLRTLTVSKAKVHDAFQRYLVRG